MANDVSIVVPVYNERAILAGAVDRLVAALEAEPLNAEVLLAENGSTDGTRRAAAELAAAHARVRVVTYDRPDYGRALRLGVEAATHDRIAILSIDWIDLDFVWQATAMLDGYDLVLGSKRLASSSDRRPLLRRVGTAGFHVFEQLLFRLPVSDCHGIKALRRDAVGPIIGKCRFGGIALDTELVTRAHAAGLRICELPVSVAEVRPARTGIARRAAQALREMTALRLALWREGLP